ncbi:RDD family protein [Cellulomonas fengjieae]|uniref:RDD family protein n=1 Tax=Cellulomonas fengjieae TaxID=2819978 RepID=UPI001AAFA7A6|nr:RDD family protein [Cellulomonas fengjieae]MBO3100841.1 RDD family protein [Cellulomonas fengjieae]
MTVAPVLPADPVAPADAPPLAPWSRRVVAALLDGSILGGATWVVLGAGGLAPDLTPTFTQGPPGDVDAVAWFTSPWLVALLLGMLALQGWTGATPGKRVAGVAVVRVSDGLPAGVLVSGVRVVAHVLDAFLMIGYLRPLWHERRQTFADSIAGTVVIQTREPPAHPWFAPVRHAPSALGSTTVSALALAACALGVGFSITSTSTSTGSSWESTVPCVADGTVATRSAVAVVSRTGGSTTREHRLWISRTTDSDEESALAVRWTWTATDRDLVGAFYETDIRRADGSTMEVSQELPSTGSASEVLGVAPATIEADDLQNAGSGWTAQTRLVVGGEVVGSCTFDSADWDAMRRG